MGDSYMSLNTLDQGFRATGNMEKIFRRTLRAVAGKNVKSDFSPKNNNKKDLQEDEETSKVVTYRVGGAGLI